MDDKEPIKLTLKKVLNKSMNKAKFMINDAQLFTTFPLRDNQNAYPYDCDVVEEMIYLMHQMGANHVDARDLASIVGVLAAVYDAGRKGIPLNIKDSPFNIDRTWE
jgi:hypothetical protein